MLAGHGAALATLVALPLLPAMGCRRRELSQPPGRGLRPEGEEGRVAAKETERRLLAAAARSMVSVDVSPSASSANARSGSGTATAAAGASGISLTMGSGSVPRELIGGEFLTAEGFFNRKNLYIPHKCIILGLVWLSLYSAGIKEFICDFGNYFFLAATELVKFYEFHSMSNFNIFMVPCYLCGFAK
jgi:hypothetical protein